MKYQLALCHSFYVEQIVDYPAHGIGAVLYSSQVLQKTSGLAFGKTFTHQTRADRNSGEGILEIVTNNGEKLLPRNKLYVGVDSFIDEMAVGLLALLFKECVDKRFFLSVFLCTNAIYGFTLSRLQFIKSFAFLNQQFIV